MTKNAAQEYRHVQGLLTADIRIALRDELARTASRVPVETLHCVKAPLPDCVGAKIDEVA